MDETRNELEVGNETMVMMSQMAKRFRCGEIPSTEDENELDMMVSSLIK